MKTYTNEELIERLLESDYPNDAQLLEGVIQKIRHFGTEAQAMFDEWYATSGISPFDVKGITPAWLRKYHRMKDVGIIIAYDWLQKKPDEAAYLLRKPVIERR
jgi:hypothetical protein